MAAAARLGASRCPAERLTSACGPLRTVLVLVDGRAHPDT